MNLEPLLFKLAVYFFANPERIIARQELAEQVWQQAYVDDNAINRAISDLRKALQHPKLTDSVLKTHHRKGYSLLWNAELQQQFSAELIANTVRRAQHRTTPNPDPPSRRLC